MGVRQGRRLGHIIDGQELGSVPRKHGEPLKIIEQGSGVMELCSPVCHCGVSGRQWGAWRQRGLPGMAGEDMEQQSAHPGLPGDAPQRAGRPSRPFVYYFEVP